MLPLVSLLSLTLLVLTELIPVMSMLSALRGGMKAATLVLNEILLAGLEAKVLGEMPSTAWVAEKEYCLGLVGAIVGLPGRGVGLAVGVRLG